MSFISNVIRPIEKVNVSCTDDIDGSFLYRDPEPLGISPSALLMMSASVPSISKSSVSSFKLLEIENEGQSLNTIFKNTENTIRSKSYDDGTVTSKKENIPDFMKGKVDETKEIIKNARYKYDEDGFQTKMKKKRIVGTKKNTEEGLRAVGRTKVIYIGRLEEDTDIDKLEKYVKDETGIVIKKCYKLKCSMRNCSSFKVIIEANKIDKLMSSLIWPSGTVVREYIFRKSNTINVISFQHA